MLPLDLCLLATGHLTRQLTMSSLLRTERKVLEPTAAGPTWSLKDSIWAGRLKWAESRDFYDTPEHLSRAVAADWEAARATGALDKLILRASGAQTERRAREGDGGKVLAAGEVDRRVDGCREVFERYAAQVRDCCGGRYATVIWWQRGRYVVAT